MTARWGRLRIAVVGAGRIGQVHARALAGRVPGARLACVVDSDRARAARVAADHDVPHAHELAAVLGDRAVNALVIATPADTHVALIHAAAAAGVPMLCEKPLAHDLAGAIGAVAAAQASATLLQVGYQRRFDRHYAELRQRLSSGEIGRLRGYSSVMRDEAPPPPERLRGERLLLDAASHDFDCARWLLGEIKEVAAFGRALDAAQGAAPGAVPRATRDASGGTTRVEYDHVITVLRTTGGVLGTVETSRRSGYGFECRTEVLGDDGALATDGTPLHGVEQRRAGTTRRALPRDFEARFADAYVAQLTAFADSIRTDSPPRVSGADGIAALRIALAAEESLRAGGAPVSLGSPGDAAPQPHLLSAAAAEAGE